MKISKLLVATALLATLAACGGNGNPQAVELGSDFTSFVERQFAATADNTDPVSVNNLQFRFPDQGNPAAFDQLL